jgi:hypothetical protein
MEDWQLTHVRRPRPQSWLEYQKRARKTLTKPFYAIEYIWEWVVYALSNWAFLEVLQYLGTFSVLIAVIFYFAERGDREKQKHYQAWQVINTAQGKGGNGGRIDALEQLNADKVPLVGVDVSGAFLQGLRLDHADLLRADLHAADVRDSILVHTDFTNANLTSTNLRNSHLENSDFEDAVLSGTDFTGADLTGSRMDGADLSDADLSQVNFRGVRWQGIAHIKFANIFGITNAPPGFVEWALKNGAVQLPATE